MGLGYKKQFDEIHRRIDELVEIFKRERTWNADKNIELGNKIGTITNYLEIDLISPEYKFITRKKGKKNG